MAKKHRSDPGLIAAIKAAKTITAIAEALGTTPQAVSLWDRVPPERCPDVSAFTGVPLHVLRPDIYPAHVFKRPRQSAAA